MAGSCAAPLAPICKRSNWRDCCSSARAGATPPRPTWRLPPNSPGGRGRAEHPEEAIDGGCPHAVALAAGGADRGAVCRCARRGGVPDDNRRADAVTAGGGGAAWRRRTVGDPVAELGGDPGDRAP